MKLTEALKTFWSILKLAKMPLLRTTLIILTILLLPIKNLLTIILVTMIYVYTFDILGGETISLSSWWKKLVLTSSLLLIIFSSYYFFGLFGTIGLTIGGIVVLLSMAGFLVWQNWKVFDAVTSWGADTIKGKTTEGFNLDKHVKVKR